MRHTLIFLLYHHRLSINNIVILIKMHTPLKGEDLNGVIILPPWGRIFALSMLPFLPSLMLLNNRMTVPAPPINQNSIDALIIYKLILYKSS
jgi:hypothetical protein